MLGCKYWMDQPDGFHGWCKHPEARSGETCILNTEDTCLLREEPDKNTEMYRLPTEQVDRMTFEEFQQRAAWDALATIDNKILADTHNLRPIIEEYLAQARDEIAVQVDDIEEACAIFIRVWEKEFGKAHEAAWQPDEED